ncbi:hypothetical protein EST38_g12355 [Candolleomyces aberdarensis]|uniref:Uncharacterized protein n=1 Tax=Candolleomyces aberdarensis TaxID=2316362 RepID=A0A4Q2D4M3_9AGAR|nr:hypothetical protein EST38_g12355 [Candolleomyces aberdarensis]
METLPSQGIWSLVLRRKEPCKIVPGNVMLLTRVTIPLELAPSEDPSKGDWRCRLLMWHLDPETKEPISRAIVASLVPGNIDSDECKIYLFPNEAYGFEVVGGGSFLHIFGEFPG